MTAMPSADALEGPHWFERIEQLGTQARQVGGVALVAAALAHGSIAFYAALRPVEVRLFIEEVQRLTLARLEATYDIELEPPPEEEKPPEPEPEPVVAPPDPSPRDVPPPEAVTKEAPPDPSPPAAATAEAAQVLTAEPDPEAPLDLTGEGFISGTGTRFAGGVTSSNGTATIAVRQLNARPDGVPGGRGTAPAPPAVDLSRPARPTASSGWNDCGFPPEADAEQVNQGRVTLVVVVDENGRAKSANAVVDPGFGFGARAERCALRKSFEPALDRYGKPKVGPTTPFTVLFTR